MTRYRLDHNGPAEPDGSIPVFCDWQYGPTLAAIRNCMCPDGNRRTVYVTAEADSYFSVPAAIQYRGKSLRGFLTHNERGWEFNARIMGGEESESDTKVMKSCAMAFTAARNHPEHRRFWYENIAFKGI